MNEMLINIVGYTASICMIFGYLPQYRDAYILYVRSGQYFFCSPGYNARELASGDHQCHHYDLFGYYLRYETPQ